uniref:Uncharacterized protein n=1 Tax=Tetranychus urticae TaxID=32264 RepID=A0A158P5C8_TETUR
MVSLFNDVFSEDVLTKVHTEPFHMADLVNHLYHQDFAFLRIAASWTLSG